MLASGRLEQEIPFEFPVALKPANSVEYLSVRFEGRKKHLLSTTVKSLI